MLRTVAYGKQSVPLNYRLEINVYIKMASYCSVCGGGADTLPLDLSSSKEAADVKSNRVNWTLLGC